MIDPITGPPNPGELLEILGPMTTYHNRPSTQTSPIMFQIFQAHYCCPSLIYETPPPPTIFYSESYFYNVNSVGVGWGGLHGHTYH